MRQIADNILDEPTGEQSPLLARRGDCSPVGSSNMLPLVREWEFPSRNLPPFSLCDGAHLAVDFFNLTAGCSNVARVVDDVVGVLDLLFHGHL